MALPPWAPSASEFLRLHRQALESPFVSLHLHQWIDLMFGDKMQGPGRWPPGPPSSSSRGYLTPFLPFLCRTPAGAIEHSNVFHPLTYQGVVDLDRALPAERRRLELQVQEFGQAPRQLFLREHPGRAVAPESAEAQQLEGTTPLSVSNALWGVITAAATVAQADDLLAKAEDLGDYWGRGYLCPDRFPVMATFLPLDILYGDGRPVSGPGLVASEPEQQQEEEAAAEQQPGPAAIPAAQPGGEMANRASGHGPRSPAAAGPPPPESPSRLAGAFKGLFSRGGNGESPAVAGLASGFALFKDAMKSAVAGGSSSNAPPAANWGGPRAYAMQQPQQQQRSALREAGMLAGFGAKLPGIFGGGSTGASKPAANPSAGGALFPQFTVHYSNLASAAAEATDPVDAAAERYGHLDQPQQEPRGRVLQELIEDAKTRDSRELPNQTEQDEPVSSNAEEEEGNETQPEQDGASMAAGSDPAIAAGDSAGAHKGKKKGKRGGR